MKITAIGADISRNDVSCSSMLVETIEKNLHKVKELGAKDVALTNVTGDDVVISASATFLVKEACRRLGIRNVICSEVDPYSGEVMGENCNGAQKPIRFREEGFKAEDIEEFYSDSYGDTPMALLAKKSYLVKGEELIDWGSDRK